MPRFKVPGASKDEDKGAALSWSRQKNESPVDLVRGKLGVMVLLFLMLGGGYYYFSGAAKRHDTILEQAQMAGEGHEPILPLKEFPSEKRVGVGVVGADGKPIVPEPAPEPKGEAPPPDDEGGTDNPPAQEGEQSGEKTAEPEEAPDAPERRNFSYKESQYRQFQPPGEKFEKLENLDPKSDAFDLAYENVFDEDLATPPGLVDAMDLQQAHQVFHLFFRYLRTVKDQPEKLAAYTETRTKDLIENHGFEPHQARATHHNVMQAAPDKYRLYRGVPHTFHGSLIKKFKIMNWTKDEMNNSGVNDTWLIICRDNRHKHYALLVPQDMKKFLSKDDRDAPDGITWTGLFVQRWSYVRQDREWDAMPVYAAWGIRKLQPPDPGTNTILIPVAIVVMIGLFFLWRQLARDEAEGDEVIRRIRQKAFRRGGSLAAVGSGMPKAKDEKKEPNASETGTVSDGDQAENDASGDEQPQPS